MVWHVAQNVQLFVSITMSFYLCAHAINNSHAHIKLTKVGQAMYVYISNECNNYIIILAVYYTYEVRRVKLKALASVETTSMYTYSLANSNECITLSFKDICS